ncbi:disks large-associated protein 5-like [Microtus oregoni]|uniref:disks large-associated protein 5-like n=1 Tax=Microtus oregoni TaxID=111838 RepID=UPI001BB1C4B8|nr:disks large-associated protein 5-like [Microtus oregoni]
MGFGASVGLRRAALSSRSASVSGSESGLPPPHRAAAAPGQAPAGQKHRMPLSHFASQLRKDLSTEMIRTSIAHRKSLSQKENRHKVYERNRHFGLRDVNIPLEGRDLVNIPELPQSLAPEKASTKTRLP